MSLPKFGVNENVKDKFETVSEDKNETKGCTAEVSSTCSSENPEENHHIMKNENLINHFTSDYGKEKENSVSTAELSPANSLDLDLGLGLKVHEKTPNYDLWKKILAPFVTI